MFDFVTDYNKSIEQLEIDTWKEESFPTPLVEKVHRYRKIPLKQLTIEHLRLLIGQNVGLKFLVPKALDILSENLLAEGDCYEGDLLNTVLNVEDRYWEENSDVKTVLQEKIPAWKGFLESRNEENTHRQVFNSMDRFMRS